MTSDLVERLRQPWPPSNSEDPLMTEAADEIERLRAALRFYAEKDNYSEQLVTASCGCCCDYEDAKVFSDEGGIARAALEDRT